MKYFIGVEPVCPHGAQSIMAEFKRQAEPVFKPKGVEFNEEGGQLVLGCPTREVRDEVREFISGDGSVREPTIPPPQLL